MTNPDTSNELPLEIGNNKMEASQDSFPIAKLTSEYSEAPPVGISPQLNREDQMALYEAALKEQDWGHQPC